MKAGALALALLLCAAVPGLARRELLQGNDMSSVSYTFSPSTSSPSPSGDSSPSPSPSGESSPSPSPSGDSTPSPSPSSGGSSPSPSPSGESSPSPSPSGDSSPSPSPSGESSPSPSNYSPSPSSNPIATVAEETPAASSSPPSKKSSATSAQGCQTALSYLKNSDDYGMLLQLINATPPKEHLADILDSPDVAIALLAPNDYGVNRTLENNGLSFKELLSDPALVLEVIQYHMLPNTVPVDQLMNGYSFNTLLPGDNFQDSVTIARNGDDITFRGAKNDAKLLDTGTSTCLSMVYSLAEMLLPRASVADAPSESATEAAVDADEPAPLQAGAALPLEGDEASGTVITPKRKFAHGPAIATAHAPAAAAGVKRIQAAAVAPAAKAPAAAAKKPAVAAKAPAVATTKPAAAVAKPVARLAPAVAPVAAALPDGTVATASMAGP